MAHTTFTTQLLTDEQTRDVVNTLLYLGIHVDVKHVAPKFDYSISYSGIGWELWRDERAYAADCIYIEPRSRYGFGDSHASPPFKNVRLFKLNDGNDNLYTVSEDRLAELIGICLVHMESAAMEAWNAQRDSHPDRSRLDAESWRARFAYHELAYAEPYKEDEHLKDYIAVCLPIYVYDHSDITVRHDPFACRWDSGQIGWHYITKDELRKTFKGDTAAAERHLKTVLKNLNAVLQGDIWRYEIRDEEGRYVDSCDGFFGDEALNSMLERTAPEHHAGLTKAWEKRYE